LGGVTFPPAHSQGNVWLHSVIRGTNAREKPQDGDIERTTPSPARARGAVWQRCCPNRRAFVTCRPPKATGRSNLQCWGGAFESGRWKDRKPEGSRGGSLNIFPDAIHRERGAGGNKRAWVTQKNEIAIEAFGKKRLRRTYGSHQPKGKNFSEGTKNVPTVGRTASITAPCCWNELFGRPWNGGARRKKKSEHDRHSRTIMGGRVTLKGRNLVRAGSRGLKHQ